MFDEDGPFWWAWMLWGMFKMTWLYLLVWGVYGGFPLALSLFNQPGYLARNSYWGFEDFVIYGLMAFGYGTIGAALYAFIGWVKKMEWPDRFLPAMAVNVLAVFMLVSGQVVERTL